MTQEVKVLAVRAWCSEFDGHNLCETARRESQKWPSDSSRDICALPHDVCMYTNEHM